MDDSNLSAKRQCTNSNRKRPTSSILWFRHGLRLHDNPALLEAASSHDQLYLIFIMDGDVAGTSTAGFNRYRFLHDCIKDLDDQLKDSNTRLYYLKGQPEDVLRKKFQDWNVKLLAFEQDPEPIWKERDTKIKMLCKEMGVQCVERVSHTLWDPKIILKENGGSPPLTYSSFVEVVERVGVPPHPLPTPNFKSISTPIEEDFDKSFAIPTFEEFCPVEMECPEQEKKIWVGGELRALKLYDMRLDYEKEAFQAGVFLPNQYNPKLLDLPLSLSPFLRFGCLSVRKFYWGIHEAYTSMKEEVSPNHLTAQLIWREFFYVMSIDNAYFDKMKGNPICLQIDWSYDEEKFQAWAQGRTGYPWIDACMRQLRYEGWTHQVCRHAVACFLTRGDLWISWEQGLELFYKYLLDADWSVCAGNWMWLSSSAFEKFLSCPNCFCPVKYGRRMDPQGCFVKRYVPELAHMPLKYLFEPAKAPIPVQEKAGCIIGKDYPAPIVDHQKVSVTNKEQMHNVITKLSSNLPNHCAPCNDEEVIDFAWLEPDSQFDCTTSLSCERIDDFFTVVA